MMRDRLWRWARVAVLAAGASLALGSVAWSQSWGYDDRGNYSYRDRDAREHGYRRGYDDGARKGQSDAERGHRFKFKTDDWEDSRGFERWMGDKRDYRYAYREGYERGYRQAYGYNGDHYRDRDDYRWRDRDDWR